MAAVVLVLVLSVLGVANLLSAGKGGEAAGVGCGSLIAACWIVYAVLTSGYTLVLLTVVAIGLAGFFLVAGLRTLRPLNECSACGYTWFPRGHDHSVHCPDCCSTR
jgi:hypothetical protein